MKTKSLFFSLLLAATALLGNCSDKKESGHDHHEMSASGNQADERATTRKTDPTFKKQLTHVFTSYIVLKDAFVASDVDKIKNAAAETKKALEGADMTLLKGQEHSEWMNYFSAMEKSLVTIQAGTDIEVQRQSFSTLSEALYKSVKTFGLDGVKAYYEFCPMAFDNGAYWLSTEEKIRNPYFGDKMLTCGSVKEKL